MSKPLIGISCPHPLVCVPTSPALNDVLIKAAKKVVEEVDEFLHSDTFEKGIRPRPLPDVAKEAFDAVRKAFQFDLPHVKM